MKELKRLERKVKKFSKQMGRKPGNFAKWFYLPENVMSKNPITKEYFNSVVIAGNFYRGNMDKVTSNLDRIVELVNMSTQEGSLMNRFSISRSKAQKKMASIQQEYQSLLGKGKKDEALKFHDENIAKISSDNHVATMQKLHELMTDPNIIFKGNKAENASKYGTNLVQAAHLWHNDMAPQLWKVLNHGIHDYITVLESGQTALGIEKPIIDSIKEKLLVKNKETGRWEMKKQENYFPTQVLDILPTFNTLTESIWSGDYGSKTKDMNEYVNKTIEGIADNLKLDGNVFERGADQPTRTSKDVISIIDTYAKGATRFNYTAEVTKHTVNALKKLHEMKGEDMDAHIQFLADYIKDTHGSAVGMDMKQSKFGKIARAITSWQFMSKLGFNVRGAARNATQSLQNYVYFGHKAIREYNRTGKTDKMKKITEKEMERHGVFFTNLEELAMPAEFLPSTKMIDGRIVESKPGAGENFTQYLERVAKFSGKPMQWVENNINRSYTFKLAFNKFFNELSRNDGILRKELMKQGYKTGKELDKAVESDIIGRSSRFAANMVKELHYEYSPFAKPKALRTAPGSILGQFSTYSINFFEYNRKILAKGADSAMHGEWNNEHAWRMYRLGATYMAIDALISPLLSTDISKLVQHDTKERLEQLYTWFTGTEADRKRVFFGKGPAIGTFGGPFVSDLITIGQLTNFMKMKENDWMSYMAGYQDFAERTKDDKVFEYVRLLNTQLARTMYGTVPKMVNGTGLTTLAGSELGLYGSTNLKQQHNELFKNTRKVAPSFMGDYLTPLSEKQRLAKGYSKALKNKPNKNVDPDDLRAIMNSLERMKNQR